VASIEQGRYTSTVPTEHCMALLDDDDDDRLEAPRIMVELPGGPDAKRTTTRSTHPTMPGQFKLAIRHGLFWSTMVRGERVSASAARWGEGAPRIWKMNPAFWKSDDWLGSPIVLPIPSLSSFLYGGVGLLLPDHIDRSG
jgi:hypothetical protein